MRLCFFTFTLFLFLLNGELFAYIKLWTIPIGSGESQEIGIELDHYYSCINYTIALTEQSIPKLNIQNESELYLHMLTNFIFPRYALFEASIYPLPIAGVYIKKEAHNFYQDAELTRGINIVRAVTDGFQEPYAASLFLGNVANFVKGTGSDVTGRGFSGFALNFGDRHIVDNIMVHDKWFETELKIKGTDYHEIHNMEWSYSMGIKLHGNEEINDQFFISVYRNRIDYTGIGADSLLGFFVRNTEQQLRIDFALRRFDIRKPSSFSFLVGKNFPIGDGAVTLAFRVGALKIFSGGYSGELEQDIDRKWALIVRPMAYFRLGSSE
ncbi:MAG: hypothetical protein LBT84_05280 [Spirochaetia bacterium]|jgi:hypothetical protein|nr:hypothetical protein [Spirochaetia bacterium]